MLQKEMKRVIEFGQKQCSGPGAFQKAAKKQKGAANSSKFVPTSVKTINKHRVVSKSGLLVVYLRVVLDFVYGFWFRAYYGLNVLRFM